MNDSSLSWSLDILRELLAIDSPVGYTEAVADYSMDLLRKLGYEPKLTKKGGVLCCLGGEDAEDGLLISVHLDTIGVMVSQIKSNGRLKMASLGGLTANNADGECVRVHTRTGEVYDGTIQLVNASLHVAGGQVHNATLRTYDTVECVLDETVHSAEDVRKLGIEVGDFICLDPRLMITDSGYIKAHFLDDKLCVAIALAYARRLKEENITPKRRLWLHLTVFEEQGHGGAATMPEGVSEILAMDMGCVGEGVTCTEHEVSICVKDSSGPFNYASVSRLIALAKEKGLGYAVDVYGHYSSDGDTAVRTFDVRHALIGPGVYASHGYERSHKDGVRNTFDLLCAYADN